MDEQLPSHIAVQVIGAITGDLLCTVEADGCWCLQDLKEAIRAACAIPTHEQKLQIAGKAFCKESQRLADFLHQVECTHKPVSVELIRADAKRTAALEHVAVGGSLTHLEESYRGDPELVLAAIKANGGAFRYASERLRSDRDFLLAAIERSCDVLCHVGDEWRCNREFVLEAIRRTGTALCYAATELRSDRNFILSAVERNGTALCYADLELRRDRNFALEAVQRSGLALRYVSEQLQLDRDFVLLAVQLNPSALRYAEEEFRSDPELVLAAVQTDEMTLGFATESLRSDGAFVQRALQRNSAALPYAAEHLKENRRFLTEALKVPGVLKHAAEEVRRDRELVVLAIGSDGAAMCYAAQSLQQDMAFVLEAAAANPASLQYVVDDFWHQKDFVMKAVEAAWRTSHYPGQLDFKMGTPWYPQNPRVTLSSFMFRRKVAVLGYTHVYPIFRNTNSTRLVSAAFRFQCLAGDWHGTVVRKSGNSTLQGLRDFCCAEDGGITGSTPLLYYTIYIYYIPYHTMPYCTMPCNCLTFSLIGSVCRVWHSLHQIFSETPHLSFLLLPGTVLHWILSQKSFAVIARPQVILRACDDRHFLISRLRQLEFVQVVLSAVQGSSQVLKKVDEAAWFEPSDFLWKPRCHGSWEGLGERPAFHSSGCAAQRCSACLCNWADWNSGSCKKKIRCQGICIL